MLKAIPLPSLDGFTASYSSDKKGGYFFQGRVCGGVYSPYFLRVRHKKRQANACLVCILIYLRFRLLAAQSTKTLVKAGYLTFGSKNALLASPCRMA